MQAFFGQKQNPEVKKRWAPVLDRAVRNARSMQTPSGRFLTGSMARFGSVYARRKPPRRVGACGAQRRTASVAARPLRRTGAPAGRSRSPAEHSSPPPEPSLKAEAAPLPPNPAQYRRWQADSWYADGGHSAPCLPHRVLPPPLVPPSWKGS